MLDKLIPTSRSNVSPVIEGTVKDFQDQWRDRCVNENVINPGVYGENVQFLSGQELYEALNWKIPNKAGFGGNRPWNEGAAFVGEDGKPWQIRLDIPRVDKESGKLHKYESVKGKGSQVFRPNVPIEIRILMREKWGVDVPHFGSFWDWFDRSDEAKKLPLTVTEGGTKCLSILSLGIPSISFYGVSSGFQSSSVGGDPKLLLSEFRDAARGKAVYFAFDSDTKASARHTVQRAIARTGRSVGLIAESIHVLEWDSTLGKGADDFIAANGGAAFFDLVKAAQDFKSWNKKAARKAARMTWDALSARAIPDISAHAATMSGCNFPLPELGEALLLSGAMGIGKTHTFGEIKQRIQQLHPDLICDAIGHRNNLLKQTSMRLGLLHIHALACGTLTAQRMEYEREMAYCIDSLWRRCDTLIRAIGEGRKVLLILDELDALMKHLLRSETLNPSRRIDLTNKFSTLLEQIASGGGWIIGGEANLTALSVESLRHLSGDTLKITVAENTIKPAPWKCYNVSAIGSDGKSKGRTAANQKQATIALVDKLVVQQGQRVMLLATSQSACEAIEGIYKRRGIKTERLDSKTSPEKWQQRVLQNAGPELRSANLALFIGSPSVECGLSIEGTDLFDAVVLYASGLEPFTSYQMLGRLRDASVPRYIVAADYSQQSGQRSFQSEEILEQWRETTGAVMSAHNLTAERQAPIAIAHELASRYEARENAGTAILGEALLDLLRFDGHSIVPMEITLDGGEGQALSDAKKILIDARIQDWTNADDSGMTVDTARMKLKDADLKWLNKIVCLKAIDRDRYGDLVDQASWVATYWGDDLQGKRLKNAILTATEFYNEGMATEADRRAMERQLKTNRTIWGPSVQGRDRKIQVLKKLNLEPLLSLVGSDAHIHGEHHLIRSVFKSALLIADEVKAALGLTVTPKSQPMAFVSDLLEIKLGYRFEMKRVRVASPEIEADELLSTQKHLIEPIGNFGYSETSDPEKSPSRGGRPKGPKTVQIKAFKLIAAPHHAEMMTALVEHHKSYQEDLEPSPTIDIPTILQIVVTTFTEWLDFIKSERQKLHTTDSLRLLSDNLNYVPSQVWEAIAA